MKFCSKCKIPKSIEEFYKDRGNKDGLYSQCKECVKQYEQSLVRKLSHKKYNQSPAGKLSRKIIQQKYWKSSVGRLSQKRSREKRLSTLRGRFNQRMSIAINRSLKAKGASKYGCHWEVIVGYKIGQLKIHLESLFVEGMDWDNYGKWHIDHKKPIISFNYDGPDHPDFKKCWALKNLQPLWAKENDSKGAKLNWKGVTNYGKKTVNKSV